MVHHLYVLNPTHKIRAIFNAIFKGSKRALRDVNNTPTFTIVPPHSVEDFPWRPKYNLADLVKTDFPPTPHDALRHDSKYYINEEESGFCIFRAENTLFKVHKCFLVRESSAFDDMLRLPTIPGNYEGMSDDAAIPLSDRVAEFRDLLWALYAVPTQLSQAIGTDSPSLERVLNVAHLANKYGMVAYETWGLERLLELTQVGVLKTAPPDLCARALNIAALCDYETLLEAIIRKLTPRLLWSDMDYQPILRVAQDRGLTKVLGVIYYKELINLEREWEEGKKESQHYHYTFPSGWADEKQRRFIAAHHSMVNLWKSIRAAPPCFADHGCEAHSECLATWTELWSRAASSSHTANHAKSDVLGRLKSMMIILKKSLTELHPINLECSLTALESITYLRDDITANLMEHFQDC
ncbi:hypothetical protein D9613_006153 [Agrocybe pediades]|uniref:BTB domain-containing protein n=1 Tax=Agrocybe pediades TaxID=84607 RepID=A0A8H4QW17_9AGAR|nr:hypothetical protein D9613_006153 [Agrocybe pediades]